MDLTPIAEVVGMCAVPIASMLARDAVQLARQRFRLDVSAQTATAIERAANAGAGMLTARLASGQMDLSHVSLGSKHVDDAVTVAMTVAGAAGVEAGITRETLAGMIVGQVGRALGQDPTVPTVPPAKPPGAT